MEYSIRRSQFLSLVTEKQALHLWMRQCQRCFKDINIGVRIRRGENGEIYCDYCGKRVASENKKKKREALKRDRAQLICRIESSVDNFQYASPVSVKEKVDDVKQLLEELKEIEKKIDS